MGKNFLDQDGQERLEKVLEYAQDDLTLVRDAIVKALMGVDEKGRRTYLWNQLRARAECIIKAHLRKATQSPVVEADAPLWSQRGVRLDAHRHQLRISAGVTDDD